MIMLVPLLKPAFYPPKLPLFVLDTKQLFIKIFICVCLCSLFPAGVYGQEQYPSVSAYPFGSDYINLLFKKDSILQAKKDIQLSIQQSLHKKDSQGLVIGYNAIAVLYEKLGNYEISRDYYKKSLAFVQNKSDLKTSLLQNRLLSVCIKGKLYATFDSLYPIAQSLSQKLQTENTLKNYLLKTMKFFEQYNVDSLYIFTKSIIPIVRATEMEELRYSESMDYNDFKKLLLYQLRLYHAFSQIKQESNSVKAEGYKNFLQLKSDSLITSFSIVDNDIYDWHRILSLLLNYKAKYYLKKGVFDSAAVLYAKADNQKYLALREYEKRLAIDGGLLYQAAIDEEEMAHREEKLKNEKKLFQTYKIMAAVAIISSFILLSFLFYYSNSQRRIKKINNELVQKNKKLLNYDKERKHFFELVSHELRTPVYGINGLATMIDSEENPEQRKEYFSSLKITAQYISLLIDNILQVSRYSFDARTLNTTSVNIKILIENIVASVHVFAKEKSIQLIHTTSIHSDNLILSLDKVVLNQIIINLIYNGIKYSDYMKSIFFDVSEYARSNDTITLQFDIRDEGRGLSYSEDLSEFVVYDRQKNMKHYQSSSGLGLTIVQELLERYNSKLFVKSDINKGTHFRFKLLLPISGGDAGFATEAPPPQSENLDAAQSITQEKAILIVDDNPLNLLITRKAVENLSSFVKVTTADNGAKAIDLFKHTKFDLVLMDLNMPDKDGFETTEALKILNKRVRVIALTALSYNNIIDKAIKVGMEDVITKPYILEDFENKIRSYLVKNN